MADASPTLRSLLTGFPAVPFPPANDAQPPIVVLTRQLSRGDEAAFREFHALYFDRLYHFLLLLTRGDEHTAREALQETLLRVARYAREFADEEIFWSWLKAIARNVVRDGGRRQRRYLSLLDRFSRARQELSPMNGAADDQCLRAFVEEGLAELAFDDRRLLEEKYLRGATVAELAVDSGVSEKAIESRLGRLRQQLGAVLRKKLRAP